ncbi:MAG: nitroreductase family deazaflavin-dependent oxidoreductase [Anaerolineae bacterium]|nr:nitroreductase family deazaflavin-dependent oxidoreductase [Anaerolineae bacterium]
MLNRLDASVYGLGIIPNLLVTLEVVGRKSGKLITFPLALTTLNNERYLVSMLGENTNWVQNVRAASGKAVIHSGGHESIRLEDVPVEQRAPILKAYLQRALGARPHIPVSKDAPITEFEKIAANYPVFLIVKA